MKQYILIKPGKVDHEYFDGFRREGRKVVPTFTGSATYCVKYSESELEKLKAGRHWKRLSTQVVVAGFNPL